MYDQASEWTSECEGETSKIKKRKAADRGSKDGRAGERKAAGKDLTRLRGPEPNCPTTVSREESGRSKSILFLPLGSRLVRWTDQGRALGEPGAPPRVNPYQAYPGEHLSTWEICVAVLCPGLERDGRRNFHGPSLDNALGI